MRFHETNDISWNFSGVTLGFHEIFEVLCRLSVLLSVLSKDDCKILASFEQIQNFKVSHFSMAKVKKVNIAVTYNQMDEWTDGHPYIYLLRWRHWYCFFHHEGDEFRERDRPIPHRKQHEIRKSIRSEKYSLNLNLASSAEVTSYLIKLFPLHKKARPFVPLQPLQPCLTCCYGS
jgi:hypothetical protein